MAYPNRLRFDLTPEDIKNLTQSVKDRAKEARDDIVAIPKEQRTFENTIEALAINDADTCADESSCYFPANVSANKEVRDASTIAQKDLSAFGIEQALREDVYNAVMEFVNGFPDQVKSLEGEKKRLLEKTIQGFKRSGLALEPEKKKRMKEIKQRLSELSVQFNKNMNEDVTKLKFSREELGGMPEDFIATLAKDEDGKYFVSLKYPELFPILENCAVEETRKQLEFANSARCQKENTPILEEAILLRQEEAKLLDFDSHANYILDIRMAKNAQTVFKFLNDLTEKLDTPSKRDVAKLLSVKKKDIETRGIPFDGKLNVWDWRYYDTLVLKQEYDVDHEIIKDYFPLHRVTEGLLAVYQQVLGLKFVELGADKRHIWHEDVQQFEVFDKKTDAFLGHFYLDLFPRDGKYGHAAKFGLHKGCKTSDGWVAPAAAMVANFTKPTATKPSLLKFKEVETYFHEFGHVMHDICSTATYTLFSGTSVERDFVEAPSQMLENWVFQAEVLDMISGHFEDLSKPLPNELREKLLNSRYVNEALKNRRQLHFGTFDMTVHTREGPVDTAKIWGEFMDKIALTPSQPGTNGAAGFGHIMGGYSAGYYGYLWSKVYSSDMFLRFKKEGVLNPQTGMEYRNYILAPGGTQDSIDSLRQFLGREPNPEAFLAEIGAKGEGAPLIEEEETIVQV